MLEKTQRIIVVIMVASCKMVPTVALQVITGILPIDLSTEERSIVYQQVGAKQTI